MAGQQPAQAEKIFPDFETDFIRMTPQEQAHENQKHQSNAVMNHGHEAEPPAPENSMVFFPKNKVRP